LKNFPEVVWGDSIGGVDFMIQICKFLCCPIPWWRWDMFFFCVYGLPLRQRIIPQSDWKKSSEFYLGKVHWVIHRRRTHARQVHQKAYFVTWLDEKYKEVK